MSQTTLQIWTALLVIGSIGFAAIAIGFVNGYTKQKRHLADLYGRLGEHKASVDKLEARLLERVKEINAKEERLVSLYSYVFFSDEDAVRYGKSLPSVTRKKLAQRIGYKILEKFHGSIREVRDARGKAFRLDILVSPKEMEF